MKLLSSNNLLKFGLYYCALVPFFDAPNMIALYIFIPLVFLYCFSRYKVYYENRYIVIFSILIFFILASCVTTNYWDLTIKQLKALLGVIMLCYTVSALSLDKTKLLFLYSLWIAYYIGMLCYIPQMEVFQSFDASKDRLNDGKLNANTIAYYTFYLTYTLFILGELVKDDRKKKLLHVLFFSTIFISLLAALFTGSRQVLIIQIPLIFFLTCIRYSGDVKKARTYIIIIITFAVSSFFLFDRIQSVFENSVIATRYEKKMEKDSRPKLMKDAIEVGCSSPIVGVGPGNYVAFSYNGHFSHCTYTELFANSGIFAFLTYVYMLFVFIKRQICNYIKYKDKLFLTFLCFGVLFAVDNLFYVFYIELWLFSFFFLVASHSEYYYKNYVNQTPRIHENSSNAY